MAADKFDKPPFALFGADMSAFRHWAPVRAARRVRNFLSDPVYRSVAVLKIWRPENLFQPYPTTTEDRNPALFELVREQVGDGDACRILSFGCATGEEVFSLRRYFAAAHIKGIDINPRCIALARERLKRMTEPFIEFAVGASTRGETSSSYDAIFCMAVLRNGDLTDSHAQRCDHLIRFREFEQTVTDLGRCLKDGGVLIIDHSNFRFCDTVVSAQFETIWHAVRLPDPRNTPIFGPDNRLMPGTAYTDVVFRKL